MYLLDTNVISELRKVRPHGEVVAWVKNIPENQLFVSAFTLAEMQAGAERTRKHNSEKAAEIEAWIDKVMGTFQILPMDARAFREWARLMDSRPIQLTEDAMIAATARVHGLTVVTRNLRDFEGFGVRLLNPFSRRS
ncbi:MAG: type II toxin-antitoxin system VapC family toxin [Silvibacterium sp.]|nr:type II toxin-antitoxin system VapC family toxin [Silvibacterium sp.]